MRNIKLYEDFINEKKPKGAPDFHHSDAPDAEGRFRDLSPKKLAAWLIKTRNKDVKKISGSLTQQVVFNRNEDPEYADKMERTRKEVYKQLGREDLLDNMKESMNNEINEKVLLIMKDVISKMIGTGFSYRTDPKMREELKGAIAAAITPILKKYDYAVQESKVNEGTFNDGEIAIYDDPRGDAGETHIFKRGKGYYGQNDSFDFEAKDKKELETKLKRWGYKLIAGSIDEAEETGERDTLAELTQMTMSQLERIEDYAEMIKDRMEKGQELDSWMFSQITVALENLNAVHDSLAGDEELEESWRINKYSPQSYAQRVVVGDLSFEEAMKESDLPFTVLMKLIKKIDKTFKLTFESKYVKSIETLNEEKAKGNRGPLKNPDIEVALKKKAEESGIDIALLRIVMRRGMDAWNSGHRPGMGQEQWGYARVNSFIDKEKGTWGGADKDVAAEVKK